MCLQSRWSERKSQEIIPTHHEYSPNWGIPGYTGLFVTRTYSAKEKLFFSAASWLGRLGIRYELVRKSMLHEFVPSPPA